MIFLQKELDILYLSFSSTERKLCQRRSAARVSEEYPERKITVVDTLAASLGQGLLVHWRRLKEAGDSLGVRMRNGWRTIV